jgi:hypothetical protein
LSHGYAYFALENISTLQIKKMQIARESGRGSPGLDVTGWPLVGAADVNRVTARQRHRIEAYQRAALSQQKGIGFYS